MTDEITIVVPTLNAGDLWVSWMRAYNGLVPKINCLIIDSSSTDDTVILAKENNVAVHSIDRSSFDHGGTRNLALSLTDASIIVYMTQDAVFENENSIRDIVSPFIDKSVGAVYGRQLPRPDANIFERYSRLRNYPAESYVRSYDDKAKYGIKTAFMSNSFAAYRRDLLESVGGFPSDQIFGEDMYVAAKLLKAGYKVAYAADARVFHSHGYSLMQDFRRYFDMGVFHAREPWIRDEFGTAEKEGMKFVISEMRYVLKYEPLKVPLGLLRTLLRYLGFRLGLVEKSIPYRAKCLFSMNSGFFKKEAGE